MYRQDLYCRLSLRQEGRLNESVCDIYIYYNQCCCILISLPIKVIAIVKIQADVVGPFALQRDQPVFFAFIPTNTD